MNFVLPKIEREASARNYGRFVIGPMEPGFGITLGNALRRVLLSSLPGAAISSIRISGVHHEFSPIPFVREDTTALLLNIKQIRLKSDVDEPVRLHVDVRSEGPVTAGDLICPPEVEIVNPELLLLTADSPEIDLDIELTVSRGRGYSPAEQRGKLPLGEIPVDAIYSPVKRVNWEVASARVGQSTNYDKLILEIWTDGTISPERALSSSARILIDHLRYVAGINEEMLAVTIERESSGSRLSSELAETPVEALDLSVRVFNSLKRTGITNVGDVLDLLEKGETAVMSIRNFGEKSLDELRQKMQEKGFLKDELPSE